MGFYEWFKRRRQEERVKKLETILSKAIDEYNDDLESDDHQEEILRNTVYFLGISDTTPTPVKKKKVRRNFKGGIDVFISSKCLYSYDLLTDKRDIHDAYVEWSLANNIHPKDYDHFFENFVYLSKGKGIKSVMYDGVPCYRGVGIRD